MLAREFWSERRPTSGAGSAAVSPSDTVPLTDLALGLYVTVAGDVCFVGADGTTDTWTVPANFIIPVPVMQVKATGTTATGIHAIK